ncbi:hypothetical protein Esti_004655 [Eimeria stiedai]
MRITFGLVVAACLAAAKVKADMRGQLSSFYKYDVCGKDNFNIAATGDRKSPACWRFAMTEDETERYENFEKEITSRPFGFRGARQRILNRFQPLAPKTLDLQSHKAALLENGLQNPKLSPEFKHKFIDSVVFFCCVSRQASDLKWNADQIKKWRDLGLSVDEELAKKSFETPTPVVPIEEPVAEPQPKEAPAEEDPPQEAAAQEAPPEEAPAPEAPPTEEQPPTPEAAPERQAPPQEVPEEVVPSELNMELVDARVVLPKRRAFTLLFDHGEISMHVSMKKPLDKCKLDDVQEEMLKSESVITDMILEKAKASDLKEAKNIENLEMSILQIDGSIPHLARLAKEGKAARFHVEGKQLLLCLHAEHTARVKAKMAEEQQIPPVVPIPVKNEMASPQEEEAKPETPEEQTPPPEPEQKEPPKKEEEAPRAPQPRTGGGRQTPEKCKQFMLNLDLSPKDIREQTLAHLVELLNEATAETDFSQVSAACLAWAANAEIYERLHMTTRRRWTAPEVVEGAPTPSHWLAVRLQTAIDVKDIKGTKKTIKNITRCTRICIDAARVMGSLMDKKRLDKPDAPTAGPASALATALNVPLDAGDTLPVLLTNFSVAKCSTENAAMKANLWSLSLTVFMSALSWYHVAVECLVQIKQEHRHLLAYLALPEDAVTDSFLSFVDQYNGVLATYKPQSSKAKSTVERAAQNCDPITLSKEKTNMPEAVGETDLAQLHRSLMSSHARSIVVHVALLFPFFSWEAMEGHNEDDRGLRIAVFTEPQLDDSFRCTRNAVQHQLPACSPAT